MSTWQEKPIRSLGKVITGKTPPKADSRFFNDGEYCFVSPRDISWDQYYVHQTETRVTEAAIQKYKNQVIPKDAVMFTSLSFGFGKLALASKSCLTNQQINSVVTNEQHDAKFVFYLLQQYRPIIFSYNSGIDTPIVPKSVFESIPVKCPELKEQQKIAAILSSYDDLIENNKHRISLLENMAEEIYREWFVRFRFPGWQESEFERGLPASWAVAQGDNVFEVVKGKSYSSEEISDQKNGGRPFINLKSFNRGGGYRSNGLKFFRGEFRDRQQVNRGDVVMAVTDMTQNREVIGRAARVPYLGETDGIISLDVVKISAFSWPDIFTYAHLRYSGISEALKELANGANVLHLKPDLIGKQKYLVPDAPTVEQFVKLVEPFYAQIEKLEQQIDMLESTRNQLLPRLISGKLSVENLDIQFPPSMQSDQLNSADEAAA